MSDKPTTRTIPIHIGSGFYQGALNWARAVMEMDEDPDAEGPNQYTVTTPDGEEMGAEAIASELLNALTTAWIDAGQPASPIPDAKESTEAMAMRRTYEAQQRLRRAIDILDSDPAINPRTVDKARRADELIEEARRLALADWKAQEVEV